MHKQAFRDTNPDHQLDIWAKDEGIRLKKVISKILLKLDTPLCRLARDGVLNGHTQYLDLEINPKEYADHRTFTADLFAVEVLSKSSGFFPSMDPDEKAKVKFREAERECLKTTWRLTRTEPERDVEECIFYIRRKLSAMLPREVPKHDLFAPPLWGPGSTKTIRGRFVNHQKLAEYPFRISSSLWQIHSDYYSQFFPHLNALSGIEGEGPYCPLACSYHFDDIARVSMVPKNSKVSRPITVEPTANVNLTLCIGKILRSILKRNGIDLTDQSRNQVYAQKALSLDLATVDLSSASDCISIALIIYLLPADRKSVV